MPVPLVDFVVLFAVVLWNESMTVGLHVQFVLLFRGKIPLALNANAFARNKLKEQKYQTVAKTFFAFAAKQGSLTALAFGDAFDTSPII